VSKSKGRWKQLEKKYKGTQPTPGMMGAAAVQFALAGAAWIDLARRPAALVNGRKAVWALVIGINFVGPLAYFFFGRRAAPQ
jgi:hypothetical protein